MQDLAAVAGKPLDRYQANFKDEQRAKMHAFGVLRNSGKQGQSILRHTLKMGRCVGRQRRASRVGALQPPSTRP